MPLRLSPPINNWEGGFGDRVGNSSAKESHFIARLATDHASLMCAPQSDPPCRPCLPFSDWV